MRPTLAHIYELWTKYFLKKQLSKVLKKKKHADSEVGRRINTWKKVTTLVSLVRAFGQEVSVCTMRGG